jgi:transcriptional regulator with XRE-family HTH domain
MSMLSTIRLNLAERLKNRVFRRKYFRTQSQHDVAQQIRELRTKRELRQVDLARDAKMQQSAVSRIEQADYSSWTFTTLLRVADALDARVRVFFEPAEDVIKDYEMREQESAKLAARFEAQEEITDARSAFPKTQVGVAQDRESDFIDPRNMVSSAASSAGIRPISQSEPSRNSGDIQRQSSIGNDERGLLS